MVKISMNIFSSIPVPEISAEPETSSDCTSQTNLDFSEKKIENGDWCSTLGIEYIRLDFFDLLILIILCLNATCS